MKPVNGMKQSRIILMVLLGQTISQAQTQAPPTTTYDAQNHVMTFDWQSTKARTFFPQVSTDLNLWNYVGALHFGTGAHTGILQSDAPKTFLRLRYTDLPVASETEAGTADYDLDGLTNITELQQSFTDPLKADSDNDSLPDGWEVAHGINPLDDGTIDPANGPDGIFPGSSSSASGGITTFSITTNATAFGSGVQAHPDATFEDKDGDGIPNEKDAGPLNRAMNWEANGYLPRFIFQPLPAFNSATHGSILMCNDVGHVLTSKSLYANGTWFALGQLETDSPNYLPNKIRVEGREHDAYVKYQPIPTSVSNGGRVVGSATVYLEPIEEEVEPGQWEQYAPAPTQMAFTWDTATAIPKLLLHPAGTVIEGNGWEEFAQIAPDGSIVVQRRADTVNRADTRSVLVRFTATGSSATTQPFPLVMPAVTGPQGFQAFNIGSTNAFSWLPGASAPVSLFAESNFSTPNPRTQFYQYAEPTFVGIKPGTVDGYCINFWGKTMIRHENRWQEAQELAGTTLITRTGLAFDSKYSNAVQVWKSGQKRGLIASVSNQDFASKYVYPKNSTSDGRVLIEYFGVGIPISAGFLLPLDLAVDSDNNDGLNLPQRDIAEDSKEDYLSAQAPANENPGKYIKLSTGDYDNDGIPDFADGMNIHGGSGTDKCGGFVPMVADLSGVMTMADARIKFEYSEASPANVTLQNVANEPQKWSPGTGDLRLWKKDGREARNTSAINNGGDFVSSNTEFSVAELGPNEKGVVTLFVEAIGKSATAADKSVTMSVKFDTQSQWIEADKVRFTAIPRIRFVETNQTLTQLPGTKVKPVFEDGTDATGQSLGGTLDSSGSTLTVGKYGPHPFAGSDETKDRERLVLTYQTDASNFTTSDDGTILIVAQGLEGNNGVVTLLEEQQEEGGEEIPPPGNYPPEVNGPETWEDTFERILFEKYEEADPRIEDLERDAFELWGWIYGGQSSEWFSTRDVWRDGTRIYVENSLPAEDAADKYYAFLKRNLPTDVQGANITPILRAYGEVYDAMGEDRSVIGQHMAKHWQLVETTAGMLESEYMFVTADFAIGSVLQIRRVRNMTFFTEGKTFAVPLIRRNWARGNITEHDTLVNSLGFTRNAGQNALRYTETIDGQAVNCIPDSIRPHWFVEIKDVRSLSATRQIRAEIAAAATESKKVCIIITGRTRRISAPLFDRIKAADGLLVRRNVNTDGYEFWNHWDDAGWEAIDKADLLQFLSSP